MSVIPPRREDEVRRRWTKLVGRLLDTRLEGEVALPKRVDLNGNVV